MEDVRPAIVARDVEEPMGPVDGEELTFLLDRRTWNDAFRGKAVQIPARGKLPSKKLAGGLKLTVVAPDEQRLEEMVPVWKETVIDEGLVPGKGKKPTPLAPGPTGMSRFAGISLGGVPAGEYELVVTVTDEIRGQTLAVTEPFAVAEAQRVRFFQ